MQKNVGSFDAMMRITFGLIGLAWSISRMILFPYRGTPILISMLSAMKVSEGVTRFCPMLKMFGLSTVEKPEPNKRPLVQTDADIMDEMTQPME